MGYPIPLPANPPSQFFINASKVLLTVNALQLALMANWPPNVQQLLFDVEQVETVKIFMRFQNEWWKVGGGVGGRVGAVRCSAAN